MRMQVVWVALASTLPCTIMFTRHVAACRCSTSPMEAVNGEQHGAKNCARTTPCALLSPALLWLHLHFHTAFSECCTLLKQLGQEHPTAHLALQVTSWATWPGA